jgi:hypothetical protein
VIYTPESPYSVITSSAINICFGRGPDKKQHFYDPAERNKETNQFLGQKQALNNEKTNFSGWFFALTLAAPTGFETATRNNRGRSMSWIR